MPSPIATMYCSTNAHCVLAGTRCSVCKKYSYGIFSYLYAYRYNNIMILYYVPQCCRFAGTRATWKYGWQAHRLMKAIEDRNLGESWSHYNNNMIYFTKRFFCMVRFRRWPIYKRTPYNVIYKYYNMLLRSVLSKSSGINIKIIIYNMCHIILIDTCTLNKCILLYAHLVTITVVALVVRL